VFLSFVLCCVWLSGTVVKAGDGGYGYLVCSVVMRSLASTKFYMDNVLMPCASLALFQEIEHEVWSLMSFFLNLIYKLCAGTPIDRIYIIIL